MLGLSVGNDSGVPKAGRSYRKSYDFASKNIGRFHTAGVSGSMKKHTTRKNREESISENDSQDAKIQKLKDRAKNYVPERLGVRQKEIEEDTMKLLELETKLEEIKRQKNLKHKREEARRLHRLQYSSACCIQRLARKWLLKRHMKAATALQSFLKFAAAKQAVAAATWAISTLRDFVKLIETKQQKKNELMKAARMLAISTWMNVESHSAADIAVARKQAAALATHTIQVGSHSAALMASHRLQKHKQRKKTLILSPPKQSSPKAKAALMWAKIRARVIPVKFKFHDPRYRRRTSFTDQYLNPATDVDHPKFKPSRPMSMADVAEAVRERQKRAKMEEVMRLHKQREEEMRQEKNLRLQMIEEQKRKRELERKEAEYQEMMRKAHKEKSKKEFFKRVENDQLQRAKVASLSREKKDKIRQEREAARKQEQEREAAENKLMYAEDTRFFQNLEKIRRQRLKEYASKRKLDIEKSQRDMSPDKKELSQHEQAVDEEKKMHDWAAREAALQERLAARRAAEKQEKENAAMEQEMIRKEKELVAMKAQLMLKRAAFMKAKHKKLKEQSEGKSDSQAPEGSNGSSSARRVSSRCRSRGSKRKAGGGKREGSGSAPTTARDTSRSQAPLQEPHHDHPKASTIYDVDDPLAGDSLLAVSQSRERQLRRPSEDWGWHTPPAAGSGPSAVFNLRQSKYSPVETARKSPLVSPGAVPLPSAEKLAMACRHGQDHVESAPPARKSSALEEQLEQVLLPTSPIESQGDAKEEQRKSKVFPTIAHTASEGKINKKMSNIASKGLLKSKYIHDKLENSPYGSLLPKQTQAKLKERTKDAPEAKPPAPRDVNLMKPDILMDKKPTKRDSLIDIVQKARDKLQSDQELAEMKQTTLQTLSEAASTLGTKQPPQPSSLFAIQPPRLADSMQHEPPIPKKKRKKKLARKEAPIAETQDRPTDHLRKDREKSNKKRKLINATYTKIMRDKKASSSTQPPPRHGGEDGKELPEEVASFFARRRQQEAAENSPLDEGPVSPRHEENSGDASNKSPTKHQELIGDTESSNTTDVLSNSQCQTQSWMRRDDSVEKKVLRHEEPYVPSLADDNYDDDFDEDEESDDGSSFRFSDAYGEDYEEELNRECDRLRAQLERKMAAGSTDND